MTECERLISDGKVPASFFEPEERECLVTVEIKKLWALQIDLVQQVEIICKRHGLKYFAIGGTALGAVRHHGFIPWDDDVDLGLLREDYNSFIEYCKNELADPYFLQIPTTDKNFFSPHIWLRNSMTTAIAHGDGPTKCNNGVLIHIFPLDGFYERKDYIRFIKNGRIANITAHNSYHFKNIRDNKVKRYLLKAICPLVLRGNRVNYYIRREAECTKLSKEPTESVGIHTTLTSASFRRCVWKLEDFSEAVMMPFEYSQIPVPFGYDHILTQQYGNYMQLPRESERVFKHTWEIAPDMPYKEYCANKYHVKY